ncbi:MAG TPA: CDP-alcohol phosphatidyltransferase family protein [Polyangiales bacterium]|nr:CDP-alcohol phosphatidyltransferase family protein [Polyangiales bacterium]
MTPKLPPFESLLKSRDVEDPVNLWVHRPLAYGFVAAVYRTSLTPNQVTLLSLLSGMLAAGCFVEGSRSMMLWGGALLWASAILDGADGILARAKNAFSELGRALDGTADALVGVISVAGAAYHLWVTRGDGWLMLAILVALGSAILHIYLYDYYKESFMLMTDPSWNGVPLRRADVRERLAKYKAEGASLPVLFASQLYVDLVNAQTAIVGRVDPEGAREHLSFNVNEQTAEIYRRHNRGVVKVWALISLAPHSYTMSICAMFDRLDVYVWIRLVLCNVLFAIALIWQRRASAAVRAELRSISMAPVPAARP